MLGRINTTHRYEQIRDLFLARGQERVFARGDCFSHNGRISDVAGYVVEGAFRHAVETPDGNERIVGYSFPGEFLQTVPGLPGDVSASSIRSIHRSRVRLLRADDVPRAQRSDFRLYMAETARDDMFGLLLLLCRPPEERYAALLGWLPDIVNEIPLKEIAALLRVTPETLSRIRKKRSTCCATFA